ncbi:MAG: (Fe-S)-binding protein [Nitrospirae bacterium]|nr:(Fe-S)-binding protein [Nitrospirota bacterium]
MSFEPLSSRIDACTLCGACKAVCPTYIDNPVEPQSARGRLALVAALETGAIAKSSGLKNALRTCLHCGRCEAVCPAKIDVQEEIFRGKTLIPESTLIARPLLRALTMPFAAETLFRAARLGHAVLYRPLKLDERIKRVPAPARVPFIGAETLFKPVNSVRGPAAERGFPVKSRGISERGFPVQPRGRIAVFAGCAVHRFYPSIGEAMLDILLALGYEVVLRQGEICCGAPARETGHDDIARDMARRNAETFSMARVDAILTACPTCAVTLKVQYPKMIAVPNGFPELVQDINQFLADKMDIDMKSEGLISYHDPCHLAVGLSVKSEPRKLLAQAGAELVEAKSEAGCCGFGGIAGFSHPDASRRIGARRRDELAATGARLIATACPGCRMQLEDAFRHDPGVRVFHTVEMLRDAVVQAINLL